MSIALLGSREEVSPGFYLTDCAVSGGTLEAFLRAVLRASGGKLCVRLRSYIMDFTLPCLSGIGIPLQEARLRQLQAAHPSHYSAALGTNYLTYLDNETLHAVLFDTNESLRRKLQLCDSLGIPCALVPDRQLRQHLRK